jgi:hypothetical protein
MPTSRAGKPSAEWFLSLRVTGGTVAYPIAQPLRCSRPGRVDGLECHDALNWPNSTAQDSVEDLARSLKVGGFVRRDRGGPPPEWQHWCLSMGALCAPRCSEGVPTKSLQCSDPGRSSGSVQSHRGFSHPRQKTFSGSERSGSEPMDT